MMMMTIMIITITSSFKVAN